ncbi:translocation/assembly module TamB domain-containing protein [Hydrogenimonas sp.]
MRLLYRRFATIVQGLILLSGTLLYIAAHPKTAELVAQKLFRELNVSVGGIDGSLLGGFTLYDLRYQKALTIRSVTVRYSPLELISPEPSIRTIVAEGVQIDPKRFEKGASGPKESRSFVLPPLTIRTVAIRDGRVRIPPDLTFEMGAEGTTIAQSGIAIRRLTARLDSLYGSAKLKGSLKKRRLKASGTLSTSAPYIRKASPLLEDVPKSLPVKLQVEMDRFARLSTSIKGPLLLREANLSVSDIRAEAEYLFKEGYFKAGASYTLQTPLLRTRIEQSAIVTTFGAYATKIRGGILESAHALPFDRFETDAAGDPGIFMADTYAGPFLLSLYSGDYRNFAIHAAAKPHPLDYIEHLPPLLSHQSVSLEANATARFAPDMKVEGVVSLDGNYSATQSYFELTKGSLLVRSSVEPKEAGGGIWESLPAPMRSTITTFLYLSKERKIFNLVAPKSDLTLFEQRGSITGWAHLGSLALDANGTLAPDGTVRIAFDAHIDSLHALLQDFNITTDPLIDAEIRSRFDMRIAERFSLRYRTEIPWYLVEPDSQHIYYGLDSRLEGRLEKFRATIDRYSIAFKDRRFDQERPSILSLDENMTLHIEKLSLLDTLVAKGRYDVKTRRGKVTVKGEEAHYTGPEGNVTADVNLTAAISPEEMAAEGEIRLRDGKITYRPRKDFVVEDEDIVIIQDIKEPSHTRRRVAIRIYADKPIAYRIEEISARFVPDITLWKEPGKPMGILGIVKITEGTIDAADKHFVIQPSEIYFGGAYPPNPYLDLHIRYDYDFYRFNIYISHTLAKPLFLFSSEPPMSQNDIMSYILFGAPADEAFKGGGEPSTSIATMLLGLGLKNAIGSATGIRFDTLNILSSENGGFGIEVGKRIGKRLRIIYRNDTVSSFIIRYKASRSIRIDVDVRDTGQGINILYVKDFRGFGKKPVGQKGR